MYSARECETIAVATGEEAKNFKGLLRINDTAKFIVDCLNTDTTEEEILEAMKKEYNAEEEILAKDIHEIIELLRGVGALEE